MRSSQRVGYYRLSGYWYPFRQIDAETGVRRDDFFDDVTFADVMALHDFDLRLRDAVFRAISAIEVALRVQVGYVLGRIDPFMHLNPETLDPRTRPQDFERFSASLHKLQSTSREDFVEHFRSKYGGRLPIWVVTEILQFGQLVALFEFAPYAQRVEISAQVGARADEYRSWLKALNILRNVAAHHSRLWNRSIGLKPQLSRRRVDDVLAHATGSVDRVYGVLAVAAYLLNELGIEQPRDDLRAVLRSFPSVPGVGLSSMKVPADWDRQELWQTHR